MDYWAFGDKMPPRKSQQIALEWLEKQTAKYLIIEAPVGVGKSAIGITYSQFVGKRMQKYRGDAFILTPQRILQEQYEQSFRNNEKISLASLYGKTNYPCASKNTTCEVGSVVKPKCTSCPHALAKTAAKNSANTILNYKLALTSFAYTEVFDPREVMILDECHTLEDHLVSFDALQISEWKCQKYNVPYKKQTDINEALQWLKDEYLPKIKDVLEDMQEECDHLYEKAGSELSRKEIKKLKDFDTLADHVDEATMMSARTSDYVNANFVLVWDSTQFHFKRLTGEYSFHRILKPKAKRFLFMSSTILDKNGFCQDLGIPPEDTAFLTLDSEFPEENRPVYYMPQMKMNYSWNDLSNKRNRDEMINTIKSLCDIHKGESGIIHAANFSVAKWLVEELEGDVPQRVFHHNPDSGDDRNSIIYAFTSSPKPGILISPSSTEGLDLQGDLGRFAIFAKVPFGFLGDQWIKRRMEMSGEWYARRALIDIIQGGGRVVRSETDHGAVYILDQSFSVLYKRSYGMIPDWWKRAYHII